VEQILIERPAEGVPHLGVGPVGQVERLESAGQAFRQALRDQQRRRAEQHHLERPLRTRILVPQSFDRLGPRGHLLDLVEHEDRAGLRTGGCIEPAADHCCSIQSAPAQRGFVRAGIAHRHAQGVRHLLDQCRLCWKEVGDLLMIVSNFTQCIE